MRRLDGRLVLTGFLVSVIFIMLILGLLYVNYQARQAGTTDDRAIAEFQTGADATTVRVVNLEITLDWDGYHRLEPLLQKLTVFIPGSVRALAASLYGAANMLPEITIGASDSG